MGGKGPPREVVVVEREDGLSATLTVDRERLIWSFVVRNDSDHAIAVFERPKTSGDSSCAGAWARFRDRDRHFLHNDPEAPITLPGAWYSPGVAASRSVDLPARMRQLEPGQQIVQKCKVQDLLRGLSVEPIADRWLGEHEFQMQLSVSYQDAYLRKQIEVRTNWITPATARVTGSYTSKSPRSALALPAASL